MSAMKTQSLLKSIMNKPQSKDTEEAYRLSYAIPNCSVCHGKGIIATGQPNTVAQFLVCKCRILMRVTINK